MQRDAVRLLELLEGEERAALRFFVDEECDFFPEGFGFTAEDEFVTAGGLALLGKSVKKPACVSLAALAVLAGQAASRFGAGVGRWDEAMAERGHSVASFKRAE